MTCPACEDRGQTWKGDPPTCAFPDRQLFSPKNWNCATVGKIRDLVYEGQELPAFIDYQYCDDQKYATVNISDGEIAGFPLALWVSWYKQRGTTDAMWLLFEHEPPRLPTLAEVNIILDYCQEVGHA